MTSRTLVAQFKRGDAVRWRAIGIHGTDRDGWTVEGLAQKNGILPTYRVRKGRETGEALQSDLELMPSEPEQRPSNSLVSELRQAHAEYAAGLTFPDQATSLQSQAADEIERLYGEVADSALGKVIIDRCDYGHQFAKLVDHPVRDGKPRCPHCLAIGFDSQRASSEPEQSLEHEAGGSRERGTSPNRSCGTAGQSGPASSLHDAAKSFHETYCPTCPDEPCSLGLALRTANEPTTPALANAHPGYIEAANGLGIHGVWCASCGSPQGEGHLVGCPNSGASPPPAHEDAKDAARYRWLRGRVLGSEYRRIGLVYSEISEIDAQIDRILAYSTATKGNAP